MLLLLLLLLLLAKLRLLLGLLLRLQVRLRARRHRRPAVCAVLHYAHVAHAGPQAVYCLVHRHGIRRRPVLRDRRHAAPVRLPTCRDVGDSA